MSWIFRIFVGGLKLTGIVRVECKELDELKRPGGLLIAANHPCLVDAVFVISRLPDVVCVMKSSILRNSGPRGVEQGWQGLSPMILQLRWSRIPCGL